MRTDESCASDVITDAVAPAKCIYVLSDVDGYKYKLVMHGEVQRLRVRDVKRYLERATGVDVHQQQLTFNGCLLTDGMRGYEAGFFDGAILRLQQVPPPMSSEGRGCYSGDVGSPQLATSESIFRASDPILASPALTAEAHHRDPSPLPTDPHDPAAHPSPLLSTDLYSSRLPSMPSRTSVPREDDTAGTSRPLQRIPQNQPAPQHSKLSTSVVSGTHSKPPNLSGVSASSSTTPHLEAPCSTIPDGRIGKGESDEAQTIRKYCHELECKVSALSIDNVRLREQLHVVARHAAEATSDWKLEEEVARLKSEIAGAEQAAAQRSRVKEEELVKELDLLREERRRMIAESREQEDNAEKMVCAMEGAIQSLKRELLEKEEALQSARLSLAELENRHQQSAKSHYGKGPSAPIDRDRTHSLPPMAPPLAPAALPRQDIGLDVLAQRALDHLAQRFPLDTALKLDPGNDTCIIPVSEKVNLLITLDREAERLYLYVTLLDQLPSSPELRGQLYEMLLEGALLGKDTAGGGVGVSTECSLVLMSISVHLRHDALPALAASAVPFVESARMWIENIDSFLSAYLIE